eukprot:gene6804-9319_t
MSNSLILSKSELNRIKASVLPSIENHDALKRKEHLKKLSNERLQHWPNTLEALRKKKESFLKDREDEAELKRQEADREEAELKRRLRLETISKANDLLYEQTDKMKMLRSKQLYTEVIHTRTSQTKDKEKAKEDEFLEAVKHHEEILKKVKIGEEDERRKREKIEMKINEIKIAREEQLKEVRRKKELELQHNIEVGIKMKEDAKHRYEEDIEAQELKQKKIIEKNFATLAANEELKKVRQELLQKEAEAEAQRDAEVEIIEQRKKSLKRLEKQRFDKAQVTRQKLIDAAVKQLAEATSQENQILSKQAQEIRDREDKIEQDKKDKFQKEWDLTVQSRTAVIETKKQQQLREDRESAILSKKYKEENELAIEMDIEKQRKAREVTTKLKNSLFVESIESKKQRDLQRQIDLEEERLLTQLATDDKKFVEVCKEQIKQNVKQGKPIYPLLKALEFSAPQLLAAKTVKVDREGNKKN